MSKPFLGEFEQMVLVATLHLSDNAFAPGIAGELESRAGRQVSRGALYATLDRLQRKGLMRWEIELATSESSGNRRRRFELTPDGLAAVRAAHAVWSNLWDGVEPLLGDA